MNYHQIDIGTQLLGKTLFEHDFKYYYIECDITMTTHTHRTSIYVIITLLFRYNVYFKHSTTQTQNYYVI